MKKLDTGTVLEILERIEIAKNFAKEDYQEDFMCETNREYKAYVKGQCNALDGILNHLQSFIEGELYSAENQTEQ
jgi:hypothetical protein